MSVLEILIVYLSVGAPFGVLVFFSNRSLPLPIEIFKGVGAGLIWPLVGLSWAHRSLLRKSNGDRSYKFADAGRARFLSDPLVGDYLELTSALQLAGKRSAEPATELFEIAGHSNPRIAAACAARRRYSLLEHRQAQSASALRKHLQQQDTLDIESATALAEECQRLGDDTTADLIERNSSAGSPQESVASLDERQRLAA